MRQRQKGGASKEEEAEREHHTHTKAVSGGPDMAVTHRSS